MGKFLLLILILATLAVYVKVFSEKPKPRRLTPGEQRQSVGTNRKGKG